MENVQDRRGVWIRSSLEKIMDSVCPERLDPDPDCPERLDPGPDPVNIGPDPKL